MTDLSPRHSTPAAQRPGTIDPHYKYYSPTMVMIGTFLGSALTGSFLLRQKYLFFGDRRRAAWMLPLGLLYTLLLLCAVPWMPNLWLLAMPFPPLALVVYVALKIDSRYGASPANITQSQASLTDTVLVAIFFVVLMMPCSYGVDVALFKLHLMPKPESIDMSKPWIER